MSSIKLVIIALFFVSCGIKGDPVPPVEPTNWGKSLKEKQEEKKENENR